jgi:hypothetical protein
VRRSSPTGDRVIWNLFWKASVPPKMRMLAWQVASRSVATNLKKHRCHLGTHGNCPLCGRERESSFHALLVCPNAPAFWDSMQKQWPLPNRTDITCTGDEWFLHLLAHSQPQIRDMIIMALWRTWHLRNELSHVKSIPGVEISCSFVSSYYNLYCQISSSVEEIIKGKSPMVLDVVTNNLASEAATPANIPWRNQLRVGSPYRSMVPMLHLMARLDDFMR